MSIFANASLNAIKNKVTKLETKLLEETTIVEADKKRRRLETEKFVLENADNARNKVLKWCENGYTSIALKDLFTDIPNKDCLNAFIKHADFKGCKISTDEWDIKVLSWNHLCDQKEYTTCIEEIENLEYYIQEAIDYFSYVDVDLDYD